MDEAEVARLVIEVFAGVWGIVGVGTVCGAIIGGAWSGKPRGINRKVGE